MPNSDAQRQLDALSNLDEMVDRLKTAFLAHPRAARYLDRYPLGTALPWMVVQCSSLESQATGLIVGGQHDDGEWDLDGSFVLFTTDDRVEGEFITVNGWLGEVLVEGSLHDQVQVEPHAEAIGRLIEVMQATRAWSLRSDLVRDWIPFARTYQIGSVPTCYAIVETGRRREAGLIISGTIGKDGRWDALHPMRLFTPDGRIVEADALLSDHFEICHDHDGR